MEESKIDHIDKIKYNAVKQLGLNMDYVLYDVRELKDIKQIFTNNRETHNWGSVSNLELKDQKLSFTTDLVNMIYGDVFITVNRDGFVAIFDYADDVNGQGINAIVKYKGILNGRDDILREITSLRRFLFNEEDIVGEKYEDDRNRPHGDWYIITMDMVDMNDEDDE